MPLSPHLNFIHQHQPAWLIKASHAQRQLFRQRVIASHRASRQTAKALATLQGIEAFCRPLLEEALPRWYPATTLPRLDNTLLWNTTEEREMSWLEAALQNFDDGTQAWLYQADDAGTRLTLDGTRFVNGARNLDLGQRYRYHLADHIDTDAFRALLREQDRAAFAAELTQARLRGQVDNQGEALGEAALAASLELAVDGQQRRLQCGYLSLFDIPLDGPLLIRLEPQNDTAPCILYLPGHPQQTLYQYPSLQQLGQALTQALWRQSERTLFTHYVSHARQAAFATRLRATLYPRYPYASVTPTNPVLEKGKHFDWLKRLFPAPTDFWQETLDRNARLPLAFTAWTGDAFTARALTQVERRLMDAASIAVPVAQRDAEALLVRIEGWLGVGLTVLNIAGLFVPLLGEVMMVIGGAQLLESFLDGVHAANEGDAESAIEHLFDVLENLAQVAALGAAGVAAQAQGALHDWQLVGTGPQQRLWHGDLSPFSRAAPWPEGTLPGADGLHRWQGQPWLALGEQAYPLEASDDGGWRLAKARGHRHQPSLQGNGQGLWLVSHERPLSWDTGTLLERAGPMTVGLDRQALEQALRCSGYDAAALRKVYVEHQPLPALLADSFETFGAQAGSAVPLPGSEILARDFPSLGPRACNEILTQARATDLTHLRTTSRLPMAMAETARLYLRDARINRALARFHLSVGATADRDTLVFAALERLPGWSGNVRLALYEDGQLRKAVGPADLAAKRVLGDASGYEPRNELDQPLANVGELFQAILQALPDSERTALGLQIHDSARLRDALFDLVAGNREQAALDLGMTPVRPMYRLPTRLPGSRRIGYRLSGRGRGWLTEDELFDQLYPSGEQLDRELLRATLRQQAGPRPGDFTRLLERLRREYHQLDQSLLHWETSIEAAEAGVFAQRRAYRGIIANRIRQAWRRENPAGTVANFEHVSLDINGLNIGELPTLPVQLPHVRQLTINGLTYDGPTNLDGFLTAFLHTRDLDLAENSLTSLPSSLGELSRLESLDLSENSLDIDDTGELATLLRLTRLRHLNLTSALDALSVRTLEQLAQLPALATFQADLNELELGAEHFLALQRWPELRELNLGQNQIELNEATRNALAGLNRLQRLSLYENPLDLPPDVTGWTRLEQLDLEYTGIGQWPIGLRGLLEQQPLVLRALDLSRNALSEAPDLADTAFAQAARAGEAGLYYAFNDNPFNEMALQRLNDAGLTTVASNGAPPDWASDWPAPLLDHIAVTVNDPQWQPLYDLLQRLADTADYQHHPVALRQRMQWLLQQLVDEEPNRLDGQWGRAQVHRQIIDLLEAGTQTCVDQASLLFQQVETEVTVWQAVSHAAPGLASDQVAIDSAASLLRQDLLDARVGDLYNARVARRRALSEAPAQPAPALDALDDIADSELSETQYLVDEIEMALHARIHLQTTLGLPPQPGEISFDYLARLSEATLERLANAVRAGVDSQRLSDWAVEQPFWQAWVRRLRPEAFEALSDTWAGTGEYFDSFSEAPHTAGAYDGPAVALPYVEALERELGNVPGLVWRVDGVLQRIDLVSNRYPDESAIYQRAAQLLLSGRQAAEAALLRQLTEAMAQAHMTH
ncbi:MULTISPECIES: dermonecrotic toxin domain-containing protein [Pseudomonas]|uniref:dermonecrotic toxin domain-containing protein n=2 Tax=Gammaproteobacteria TaxID=1236 RepID=UPI001E5C18B2|nr:MULTISPECIES: DUF6543 domain-containing protein [Pseudomonas]MCE1113862.1 hypothetical protein [Pseudomonas sp. NMI795_08]